MLSNEGNTQAITYKTIADTAQIEITKEYSALYFLSRITAITVTIPQPQTKDMFKIRTPALWSQKDR